VLLVYQTITTRIYSFILLHACSIFCVIARVVVADRFLINDSIPHSLRVRMGTVLSAATSRHHRRIETSSDGPPGVAREYRCLNERRRSRTVCSDSSPAAAVATSRQADNRTRDRLPLKSPVGKSVASPPPSPRTNSSHQRISKRSSSSKFFSRFGLRNGKQSVTSKKATQKLEHCNECQDCDSGCLQVLFHVITTCPQIERTVANIRNTVLLNVCYR
jgi:hypothetical protein